jgi:large subunit ribosomal protein L15
VSKTGQQNFDLDALVAAGIAKSGEKIKVLGNGKLKSTVNVSVHAISASAKAAIEALGGSVQLV